MPSKKIKTRIEPGNVYHIYNRGNNFEKTFFKHSDYKAFLLSLKIYLKEVSDLYAFALLENHFHLLLRVKENSPYGLFSRQYQRWILHYTNNINTRERRSGSLFLNPFRRLPVENENYLKRLIFYIHNNPEKHHEITDFKTSQFTSFPDYLSDHDTIIKRDYIFDIFGSKLEFIEYHQYMHDETLIKQLLIEE